MPSWPTPSKATGPLHWLVVNGANLHNLQDIEASVPSSAWWPSPACPARANPRWRAMCC